MITHHCFEAGHTEVIKMDSFIIIFTCPPLHTLILPGAGAAQGSESTGISLSPRIPQRLCDFPSWSCPSRSPHPPRA